VRRVLAAAAAVVVALLAYGVAPSAATPVPSITVTPTTGLTDATIATVTGTGWSPASGLAGVFFCTTADFNAAPASGTGRFSYLLDHCKLRGTHVIASDGTITTTFSYDRISALLPCGLAPGDCVLVAVEHVVPVVAGNDIYSNAVPVSYATPPPPPRCRLDYRSSTQIGVEVIALTGVQSVTVTKSTNASVYIYPFAVGEREVGVSATKVDPTKGAQVALHVRSVRGETVDCDPIVTTVTGGAPAQHFTGVGTAEHFIRIDNDTPGLRHVTVSVGHRHRRIAIAAGGSKTVDFAQLLPHGATTYALRLRGAGRGAADVLVWDGTGAGRVTSG
jgi:hypothetical protein